MSKEQIAVAFFDSVKPENLFGNANIRFTIEQLKEAVSAYHAPVVEPSEDVVAE